MGQGQGLAQQQAMGQQQPQQQVGVEQVAAMLMQGVTPEELVQKGVPVQVIEQAMMLIQQQQQPQAGDAGLAGRVTQGGM